MEDFDAHVSEDCSNLFIVVLSSNSSLEKILRSLPSTFLKIVQQRFYPLPERWQILAAKGLVQVQTSYNGVSTVYVGLLKAKEAAWRAVSNS